MVTNKRKHNYPRREISRGVKEMEAERMTVYEELRCEAILRVQIACEKINKKILKSKKGKLSIFSDGKKVKERVKKYCQS